MKLSKAVAQFIGEIRMSKAKGTAEGYGSDLQQLVTLARPDSILKFDDELVTNYFLNLSSSGCSRNTLCRRSTALNQFGRWGMRKGLWTKNPMEDPKFKFKKPDSLPKPFDPAEAQALMQTQVSDREHVARALLYYTGLRVTPICEMKIADVSFSPLQVGGMALPGSIRTTSKGGRKQLVPMAPELAHILQDWLQAHPGKTYDPVLRYDDGRPVRRRSVERWAENWGKAAGVANCIPHRFRHTYATDLRRRGVALDVIQRLLGHSSISTTQVYAKVADEELVAAVLTRHSSVTPPPPAEAAVEVAD